MTLQPSDLPLHERTLLLALDDDRGTIHSGAIYSYAVAGALLAEPPSPGAPASSVPCSTERS